MHSPRGIQERKPVGQCEHACPTRYGWEKEESERLQFLEMGFQECLQSLRVVNIY